jgi:hypothetical protein
MFLDIFSKKFRTYELNPPKAEKVARNVIEIIGQASIIID